MPGIVCAIRGGPASRPTIVKSIQLAAETHLPIYFLYVVNLNFLSHSSSSKIHLVTKEMTMMGEFILLTAQSEAQSEGIEANGVVRTGKVRDEIVALCQEIDADYVVLGKPKEETDKENVFTTDRLDQFGQRIQQVSRAKIVLA